MDAVRRWTAWDGADVAMDETTKSSDITLADLLGAFSLATDLGLGQPMSQILQRWPEFKVVSQQRRWPTFE